MENCYGKGDIVVFLPYSAFLPLTSTGFDPYKIRTKGVYGKKASWVKVEMFAAGIGALWMADLVLLGRFLGEPIAGVSPTSASLMQ